MTICQADGKETGSPHPTANFDKRLKFYRPQLIAGERGNVQALSLNTCLSGTNTNSTTGCVRPNMLPTPPLSPVQSAECWFPAPQLTAAPQSPSPGRDLVASKWSPQKLADRNKSIVLGEHQPCCKNGSGLQSVYNPFKYVPAQACVTSGPEPMEGIEYQYPQWQRRSVLQSESEETVL